MCTRFGADTSIYLFFVFLQEQPIDFTGTEPGLEYVYVMNVFMSTRFGADVSMSLFSVILQAQPIDLTDWCVTHVRYECVHEH